MNRPDFEQLYKVCYKQFHSFLNEVDDLLQQHNTEIELTGEDVMGMLRQIHDKYITHDWSN